MFSRILIAYLLYLFCASNVAAQNIRINEVVSSNSTYFDEDGDSPDWIELHNSGSQNVSLHNWSLSDDLADLTKWVFPNMTLAPDQYALLWASSKDRAEISYATTLINQGDSFRYLVPNSEPDPSWKNIGFNDSSWEIGASGFGYNDGDDTTLIPTGSMSVYLRVNFEISALDNLNALVLDIDYDDAFVAYINGIEIARANINGSPPAYNSGSLQDHEALMYSGGTPDRFTITNPNSLLNNGENILTIQGHNISNTSSDFTIIPFLSAIFSSPNNLGVTPPEILGLNSNNLHTNFKIASDSETLTLSNAAGTIVDQLSVENLPPDTSYGVSVTNGSLVSYLETTPGYENATNSFTGAVGSTVVFSNNGGFLSQPVSLSLSGNLSGQSIRYTTDASVPTTADQLYTTPIQLSDNAVIRARIFQANHIPSPTFTKSYLFDDIPELDTVFLTTDPENLFDEDTGIYVYGPEGTYDTWVPFYGANFWEDWERPVHLSFYESGSGELTSEFNAGLKIFGGWSRGQNPQRSLALFARRQYGDSKFEETYFENVSYNDFQSIVLRNSGQDWVRSSIKDITLTSLMRGSGLDFQEHNSVATYINGEYWGLYNLREKNNEDMLASKHNINADQVTILTNDAEVLEGDNTAYNTLISYVASVDLSVESNFNYVRARVDLANYALYQAANIFYNNTDWPGNNIKFWTHPNGKWRWIMYDTDFGFGPWWSTNNYWEDTLSFALEENGTGWPNPAWSTLLFRKLISNIGFRNQFINRYADEMNTRFLSDKVKTHIEALYQKIASEIPFHYQRWDQDPNVAIYYRDQMKIFADQRPNYAKEHIKSKFNLPNYHAITIINNDTSEGFVEVNNNLKIQQASWNGDYFETVPFKLEAIAEAGYEFSHWGGGFASNESIININLTETNYIIPYFSPLETHELIVINEINYNSSPEANADDWIELYNPNPYEVDVSLWQLKDNNDIHIFTIPAGTSIPGEGFIVVVKDIGDFSAVFAEAENYVGELGFGLGSSGDSVRLFDASEILQDQVTYTSESPWPDCANDTGYTLELIDPTLDNSNGQNWSCINLNGSPNAPNTETLSTPSSASNTPLIFPNPTQTVLNIIGNGMEFNLAVYSVTGQKLMQEVLVNKVNVEALPVGIYFIKIYDKSSEHTLKFIKQ